MNAVLSEGWMCGETYKRGVIDSTNIRRNQAEVGCSYDTFSLRLE
jgi:hypothetical protein